MKSFYPVLYLCFLFGLLPFLGSCSEENESSGTIEMNQLPGTAQSFLVLIYISTLENHRKAGVGKSSNQK